LDADIVESKMYSARQKQKIAEKNGLENEKSQASEGLITRIESQRIFLVELLQRKESVQHQIDAMSNQEPLLSRMEQTISELEKAGETSAYAKKQLHKIEEDHNKLSTLQVTALELISHHFFIHDELIE
jgi:hypothetical protein